MQRACAHSTRARVLRLFSSSPSSPYVVAPVSLPDRARVVSAHLKSQFPDGTRKPNALRRAPLGTAALDALDELVLDGGFLPQSVVHDVLALSRLSYSSAVMQRSLESTSAAGLIAKDLQLANALDMSSREGDAEGVLVAMREALQSPGATPPALHARLVQAFFVLGKTDRALAVFDRLRAGGRLSEPQLANFVNQVLTLTESANELPDTNLESVELYATVVAAKRRAQTTADALLRYFCVSAVPLRAEADALLLYCMRSMRQAASDAPDSRMKWASSKQLSFDPSSVSAQSGRSTLEDNARWWSFVTRELEDSARWVSIVSRALSVRDFANALSPSVRSAAIYFILCASAIEGSDALDPISYASVLAYRSALGHIDELTLEECVRVNSGLRGEQARRDVRVWTRGIDRVAATPAVLGHGSKRLYLLLKALPPTFSDRFRIPGHNTRKHAQILRGIFKPLDADADASLVDVAEGAAAAGSGGDPATRAALATHLSVDAWLALMGVAGGGDGAGFEEDDISRAAAACCGGAVGGGGGSKTVDGESTAASTAADATFRGSSAGGSGGGRALLRGRRRMDATWSPRVSSEPDPYPATTSRTVMARVWSPSGGASASARAAPRATYASTPPHEYGSSWTPDEALPPADWAERHLRIAVGAYVAALREDPSIIVPRIHAVVISALTSRGRHVAALQAAATAARLAAAPVDLPDLFWTGVGSAMCVTAARSRASDADVRALTLSLIGPLAAERGKALARVLEGARNALARPGGESDAAVVALAWRNTIPALEALCVEEGVETGTENARGGDAQVHAPVNAADDGIDDAGAEEGGHAGAAS